MSDGTNGSGNGPGNELGNGSRGDEYQSLALMGSGGIPDQDEAAVSAFEIELYMQLNASKDIKDFSKRISGFLEGMGFSDWSFVRLYSLSEPEENLVTLPAALRADYWADGFHDYDLNHHYAKQNSDPIYQSTIEKFVSSAPFAIYDAETVSRNREMYRMLKSHGFYDLYFLVSALNGERQRGQLSITRENMRPEDFQQLVEKNKGHLRLLSEAIDHVGTNKYPEFFLVPDDRRNFRVSPRPLKLLTTLARDDLTLNEAAEKMCISIHTANQHIAAARSAFGASTNTGAVYRALRSGLIKLHD